MHKSELGGDTKNWAEARQRSHSRRIDKRFLLGCVVHRCGFPPFIHAQFSLQPQSQFTSIRRSIDIRSTSSLPLFANLYIRSLYLAFPSSKVRKLMPQSGIQSIPRNMEISTPAVSMRGGTHFDSAQGLSNLADVSGIEDGMLVDEGRDDGEEADVYEDDDRDYSL